MFTVCPKCDLTLAITARDLRAAQGHVRCGRCHNVFNALDSLMDEHPQAPPRTAAAGGPDGAPGMLQTAQPAEPRADLPDVPESPASWAEHSATLASAELSAEFEPERALEAEPHPLPPDPEPETALEPREAGSGLDPDRSGESPDLEPPAPPAEAPEAEFALEPDPPGASIGWAAGAVALGLLLALQIVNHYRDALATFPSVAGPLSAVYGALGIRLTPEWDVRAYDARQLGATVSGTNPREITVRASIANLAHRAQPLPLLRVTLQDRFGRAIAAQDVAPRNYLRSVPSPALLPPGGRVDASVAFLSPGTRAVGFEIDACLPEEGTVVCAHGS